MLFNFRLRPMGEIDPWGPIPSPDAKTPDWLRGRYLDEAWS